MKLRGCALMCALFYGAQAAAGTEESRADGRKEPGETEVRIEKVEPEKVESEPSAERARAEAVTLLPLAVPTPLGRVAGDSLFREAYADVYRILSAENGCSRFYGGPARAARVFNDLAGRMKPAPLVSVRMAGSMSGGDFRVTHAPTGFTYRLFEQSVLNSEGPFYRRQISSASKPVPGIGRFGPGTREARALILLHELGHLVRGADGKWLLKDDGRDESLSTRNTELVEDKCGAQISVLAASGDAPRVADNAPVRPAAEDSPDRDEF